MQTAHVAAPRWMAVGVLLAAVSTALLMGARLQPQPSRLVLHASNTRFPADGISTQNVEIVAGDHRRLRDVQIQRVNSSGGARIDSISEEGTRAIAVLRAGTAPGYIVIQARAAGLPPATLTVESTLDLTDSAADGTPDFLRLDDEADRAAFRRWFTYLAEDQYFRLPGELPAEVNDCAALIRFAYRESLRAHDGRWASELRLKSPSGHPSIRKYQYPSTALGAGLFRVRSGQFQPDDIHNGAFAQFADGESLRRFNTHFVSRDLRRAQPGDLLLFHHLGQRMPFHAMVFIGHSQFTADDASWIVYHTGPSRGDAGEIRRLSVGELLQYPLPQWRPTTENPAFLGVYRWNILRGPA